MKKVLLLGAISPFFEYNLFVSVVRATSPSSKVIELILEDNPLLSLILLAIVTHLPLMFFPYT